MRTTGEKLRIPGAGPISLRLGRKNRNLRERALRAQKKGIRGIPTLPLIDARTWKEREEGEDWLMWRARRTASRLRNMPLDCSPDELITGRPKLRDPTPREEEEIRAARETLSAAPPYPGGDAGHFHPDYETLFSRGIGGLRDEIRGHRKARSKESPFYRACEMALQGLSDYILRVANACQSLADASQDETYLRLVDTCRRVATRPPSTFQEAIQLMFLTLIALWFGEDHHLTTPGRMDRTLLPFYRADIAAQRITPRGALELISCLYIQLNLILGRSSAVSVLVGGRNERGNDATSELTYLCLAARQATRLVYPTVGLAWHEGTPDQLMDFALNMVATGIGDPALFNEQLIVPALRDHGVTERDSFNYMNSTCVEIKVAGASNIWVTAPYFNCPGALMEVLDGVNQGHLPRPGTFQELNRTVRAEMEGRVASAARDLDRTWEARSETGCFPLASCFTADCLKRGQDFDRGGPRYQWVENSFVGLANLIDGLLAIKHLIYQENELSLTDFMALLSSDFADHEPLRQRILNQIPSYGNNLEEPDRLAAGWATFLQEITGQNRIGPHRYVPGFFCWVMHERFGSQMGATPDGRQAGFPLADGAGPAQGRETSGPTASVMSTTSWSHRGALGGLVHNLKLSAGLLEGEAGRDALRGLLLTYLKRGGFEIQVNVVSTETLRQAQREPEAYRDLLVRVAGYSDYFVDLNTAMQEEIIARTEHSRL